jgi:hypothetical protein
MLTQGVVSAGGSGRSCEGCAQMVWRTRAVAARDNIGSRCCPASMATTTRGVGEVASVSKNGLFEPFLYTKRSFYQDRLGTNMGKHINGTVFPQVNQAEKKQAASGARAAVAAARNDGAGNATPPPLSTRRRSAQTKAVGLLRRRRGQRRHRLLQQQQQQRLSPGVQIQTVDLRETVEDGSICPGSNSTYR